VHEVAEHVGTEHTDITLSTEELMDAEVRSAALHARDLPSGMGDMDTSLYLLFRSIREHSTVALSGESADEVFGGYRDFHDADTVAADTFPWLAGRMLNTDPTDPGLWDADLVKQVLSARVYSGFKSLDCRVEIRYPSKSILPVLTKR